MVVYFSRLHRIARLRSDSNGARVESRIFQRGWVRRIQVRRPGELQSDAARSAVYEEAGRNDCLRALPCSRALRQRPGTCAACAAKDPVGRTLADLIFYAIRCQPGRNSRPILSALAVFFFLVDWNAFLWPLTITTDQNLWLVQLGIASFQNQYSASWNYIMAASVVVAVPTLILLSLIHI